MKKETAKTTKKTKSVEQEQPEQKVEATEGKVGILLKEARLKKEKTTAEIAKSLCIRRLYLDAIEASDYAEIPDAPYGIGFVRSYAEYLGLNSNRLVQLFKEETDANNKKQNKYFIAEPPVEVAAPSKKYLIISLAAIVIIYFAWFLLSTKEDAAEEPQAAAEVVTTETENTENFPLQVEDYATVSNDETVVVSDSQEAATEEVVEEPAPAVVEEPKKETGVELKVKEESWVEVKDANKLYISKVLKAGDTYKLPEGGKGMIYSVGKKGAVEVYINGELVDVIKDGKKTKISIDQFLNH